MCGFQAPDRIRLAFFCKFANKLPTPVSASSERCSANPRDRNNLPDPEQRGKGFGRLGELVDRVQTTPAQGLPILYVRNKM